MHLPQDKLTAGTDSTLDWSSSAAFKGVRRALVPEFSIGFLQGNAAGAALAAGRTRQRREP